MSAEPDQTARILTLILLNALHKISAWSQCRVKEHFQSHMYRFYCVPLLKNIINPLENRKEKTVKLKDLQRISAPLTQDQSQIHQCPLKRSSACSRIFSKGQSYITSKWLNRNVFFLLSNVDRYRK